MKDEIKLKFRSLLSKIFVIKSDERYGTEEWISFEDIIEYLQNIHHTPEDWDNGDIEIRISQYDWYKLGEIDIEKTDYENYSYDEERIEKIKKLIIENNYKYPPIVYDSVNETVIDGIHRIKALKDLGIKRVKAYIGDPESQREFTDEEIEIALGMIELKSSKLKSRTFLITKKEDLDTQKLNYSETDSKIDKFTKRRAKKFRKKEEELREWIEKFFSNRWYDEEIERINVFESIGKDIEGFQDDVEIEEVFYMTTRDGERIRFEESSPNVDKTKIQQSIQNIIPKYTRKARNLLEVAKTDLEGFAISNLRKKKEILKIISEKFNSYWRYLGFLRNAFVDILKLIQLFDYSITIKFLMHTIILEIYKIDEQEWYKDSIFTFKNVLKLLREEI